MKKFTLFADDETMESIAKIDEKGGWEGSWGKRREYFTSFAVRNPRYHMESEEEKHSDSYTDTIRKRVDVSYDEREKTYEVEALEHVYYCSDDGDDYDDAVYDRWAALIVEGEVEEERDGIKGVVVELDDEGYVPSEA